MKRLGDSLRSSLGIPDQATEEKVKAAEELGYQANEHYVEYKGTNDLSCLHKAVQLAQQGIDIVDEEHIMHTFERNYFVSEVVHGLYRDQCISLRGLFYETDDIKYLNQSIGTVQLLYAFAPKLSREQILEGCLLHRLLIDRYLAQGEKDQSEYEHAVAAGQLALSSVAKGKGKKLLSNPDDTTLRSVIKDTEDLINSPPETTRALYLYSRGGCSIRRYHRERNIEMIKSARKDLTSALELLPATHEKYTKAAVDLADCEYLYIEQTSDISGLDLALQSITALDLSTLTPDDYVSATTTKSLLLRCKFDWMSNPDDLDHSIEAAQQSTRPSAATLKYKLVALDNLSTQLGRRANLCISTPDIEAAIQASETALKMCAGGALHQRAKIYANLGLRLGDKYANFGDLEDLVASIQPLRNAVTDSPPGHGMRAMRLHNLANALRNMFSSAGALEPLEESISVEREALGLVSAGDSHRYVILDGLALSLNQRFRRLRHSEDLDEAIIAAEEALAGTPKGKSVP